MVAHDGFEPSNAGVKVLCLTAWLMSNIGWFLTYPSSDKRSTTLTYVKSKKVSENSKMELALSKHCSSNIY